MAGAGAQRDAEELVAAIFEAERPALEGTANFIAALSSLLAEWQCQGTLQDALAAWTMIESDSEMLAIVKKLQRAGFSCCLATNQEPHRAGYMSEPHRWRIWTLGPSGTISVSAWRTVLFSN